MKRGQITVPEKYTNMLIMVMVVMSALMITIGFMTVFNVASQGWTAAAPLVILVVGLAFIGLTQFSDRWNLSRGPGAFLASSLGAGIVLGLMGVLAKML